MNTPLDRIGLAVLVSIAAVAAAGAETPQLTFQSGSPEIRLARTAEDLDEIAAQIEKLDLALAAAAEIGIALHAAAGPDVSTLRVRLELAIEPLYGLPWATARSLLNRHHRLSDALKRLEGEALAGGRVPIATELQSEPAGTASLAGTVTDAVSGAPVAGAQVFLECYPGGPTRSSSTSEDGTYSFTDLPATTCFVRVARQGYATLLYDGIPCPSWQCPASYGTPIPVAEGAEVDGIDLALLPRGTITGRITSHNGTPVPEAQVMVRDSNGNKAWSTSGTGGVYVVNNLKPGWYQVGALAAGFVEGWYHRDPCGPECPAATATLIQVTAGSVIGDIDISLQRSGAISGRVIDRSTGLGVNQVNVVRYSHTGDFVGNTYTNSEGFFRLESVASGVYLIRAIPSQFQSPHLGELYEGIPCHPTCDVTTGTTVGVTMGEETTGVDFSLLSQGRFKGTITAAATGFPVDWAQVSVVDDSGLLVDSVHADQAGMYQSPALPEGIYFSVARSSAYLPQLHHSIPCDHGACDPTTGTPIPVTVAAVTDDVDFALTLGGWITGQVRNAVTGLPAVSTGVRLFDSDGTSLAHSSSSHSGGYIFRGLAPGIYYAVAGESYSSTFQPQLYQGIPCPDGCDPTTGTPLAVSVSAGLTGVDFELLPLGRISGTVTRADTGALVQYAQVAVYNHEGTLVSSSWTGFGSRFTTAGLPDGVFYAIAGTGTRDLAPVLYEGILCDPSCDPTLGTAISVTAGQDTADTDFALPTRGRIRGRITQAGTGAALGQAWVQFFNSTGQVVRNATASTAGEYDSGGLSAGEYFVTASRSDSLRRLFNDIPCHPECPVTGGTPVTVSLGAETDNIDIALPRAGSIAGSVTDADTGEQLNSGTVGLYNHAGEYVKGVSVYSQPYKIQGLVAGTYFAMAQRYSYVGQLFEGLPCHPTCDPTVGTPIQVADGQDVTGVDFAMRTLGSIAGRVTVAGSGGPARNVVIYLYRQNGGYQTSVSANQWGEYSLPGLSPGTYFARTLSDGYEDQLYQGLPCDPSCNILTGTPVLVEEGSVTPRIDFSLAPRHHLLTIQKRGTGTGVVTATPPVIDCGAVCSAELEFSTLITLTAIPDPGSVFMHWLPLCESSDPCSLIVDRDVNLEAVFRKGFAELIGVEGRIDSLANSHSNGNRILEPGETVAFHPAWRNPGLLEKAVTGEVTSAEQHLVIVDSTADYGEIPAQTTRDSLEQTGNTYFFSLPDAGQRPATHWDIQVTETLSTGESRTWIIHVGESFEDVGVAHWAYPSIEALLHSGITAGCTETHYCPEEPVSRWQMAVFLAKALVGDEHLLPAAGTIPGMGSYDCGPGGTSVFTDVPHEDSACRHIHFIAAEGITAGCDTALYCPWDQVTRWQMGVFLAKATATSSPFPEMGLVPDLGHYLCRPGGLTVFSDIQPDDPACRHIHYIAAKGVTAGCGDGKYCPAVFTTRDQMAVFLTKGFSVSLH